MRHAQPFEEIFEEISQPDVTPSDVINAVVDSQAGAQTATTGTGDPLVELKDAMVKLNSAADRLASSNGNGEIVGKLNTVLQFLQVVLTISCSRQSSPMSTPTRHRHSPRQPSR
jgi:hypothetical protein